MVLILLNIFVLSGLLASSDFSLSFPSRIPKSIHQDLESDMSGNGVQNWFNRQGLKTQVIQDPSRIDVNDPEGRSDVIYI
jgi:hypothetical protein